MAQQADISLNSMASRPRRRSGDDLAEVMRQRRQSCAEFVKQPENCIADVASSALHTDKENQTSSGSNRTRAHTYAGPNTPCQIRSWMEQIRGSCHVLESTPALSSADVLWSDKVQAGKAVALESEPTKCMADVRWSDRMQQPSNEDFCHYGTKARSSLLPSHGNPIVPPPHRSSSSSCPKSACDASLRELAALARSGKKLPSARRVEVWREMLRVSAHGKLPAGTCGRAPLCLQNLLSASTKHISSTA